MRDISHYKRDKKGVFITIFGKRTKICKNCNKEYTPQYKNFKRSTFCSRSCQSSNTGKSKYGEKSRRWITERTILLERGRLYSSQRTKDLRKAVFERDNNSCQECGASGIHLETHHIIPVKTDINKIFEFTNMISLCESCHKKTRHKEMDFTEKYSLLVKN